MFFRTSGNSADTSLPNVIDIMVFWIASFLSYAYCDTSPALNSKVSPFLGTAKAPLILLTAIARRDSDLRSCPSYTGGLSRGVDDQAAALCEIMSVLVVRFLTRFGDRVIGLWGLRGNCEIGCCARRHNYIFGYSQPSGAVIQNPR